MNRRGVALLTVLWAVSVLSVLAATGLAAVRTGERTSFNRIALARGRWAAEGCLAIAQARGVSRPDSIGDPIDLGTARCSWRISRTSPDARSPVDITIDGWIQTHPSHVIIAVRAIVAGGRLAVISRTMR